MLYSIVVLLSQLVANMALAAVYKDVLEHGVPDKRTRKDLIEAKKIVKKAETPFGSLHQQLLVPKQNGQAYGLNVIHPDGYAVALLGNL